MTYIGHAIAECARRFIGTPFLHQGRQPGKGLDCVGVAFCAAWECGLKVPDFRGYGKMPDPDKMVAEIAKRCDAATEGRLSGDLIVFAYRKGKAAHMAVACGEHIVHAYESAGGVVCTPLGHWAPRIHSRWRLRWPA